MFSFFIFFCTQNFKFVIKHSATFKRTYNSFELSYLFNVNYDNKPDKIRRVKKSMHSGLHLFSKKASCMAVSQGIKTKMLWFKLHSVIHIKCENILEYI